MLVPKLETGPSLVPVLGNLSSKGDALLQKTYVGDYLTKKIIRNNGEVQQYYVKEHHEPIIEPEIFDQVQIMIEKHTRTRGSSPFSGMIHCAECGGIYGPKTWHSNSKYKKVVWQCNAKFESEHHVSFLDEKEIKDAFVKALNQLIVSKTEMIAAHQVILTSGFGVENLEEEKNSILERMENIEDRLNELVDRNVSEWINPHEYDDLNAEYDALSERLNSLNRVIHDKKDRLFKISEQLKCLESMDAIEAFDETQFRLMVEEVKVLPTKELCFHFWDGSEQTVAA